MHSSPIMLTLFDQETVMKNFLASVAKEARIDENLKLIRNLMKTTKWSAVDAMTAMGIPADQQAMYAAQL